MILVDLNQVMISNLMMQIQRASDVDESMIRHMVLNSLRMYNVKFREEYGDLVICTDDKNYWRRQIFPYYKHGRKKDREASDLDWNLIFESLNKIRDEIKENLPYKVIQIEHAEADDVIATLCHKYGVYLNASEQEKILILSSDKDFMQLQKFVNVEQFSPMAKKFLKTNDPYKFLREHVLKGDRGDGIPNFLSSDDVFVTGTRQKPVTEKKLNSWLDQNPEDFCDEMMLRNYQRNEMLIDLSKVPEEIQTKVLETYDTIKDIGRSKIFNYFVKHRLKMLMEHIQEF